MEKKAARWRIAPSLISPEARSLYKDLALFFPGFAGAHLGGNVLLGANGLPLPGISLTADLGAERRITPYGLGVGSAAGSNLLSLDNVELITTSNGAGTGDFTLMILANPIAENRISWGIAQGNSDDNTNTWLGFNNAPGSTATASSGTFTFSTREVNANTNSSVSSALDGNYHSFIGRRQNTAVDSIIDGFVRGTNSGTIRDIANGTLGFAIGQRPEHANAFRIDSACNVVIAAAWNRALTNREIQLLARKPLIMLQPYVQQTILGQVFASGISLSPANLALINTLTTPNITQNHLLAVANLFAASTLASPSLTQIGALSVDNLAVASILQASTITQNHVLSVAALLSASAFTAPALNQNHILVPASLSIADILGTPSLNAVAVHTLAPANLLSALVQTAPVLSQVFPDSRNFVKMLQLLAPYDINEEFIAWVETNFTVLKEGIELLKTLNVEGLSSISGSISGTHKLIVFDPETNEPKLVTKSDFLL